jgi:hypothetical protein
MFDRRRYASYANNTKWSELRDAMVGRYPRAPSFRVKTLNWLGESRWDVEWYYHFRSDYDWKDMVWVDMKPQPSVNAISSDEIETICRHIGFEIERHGDVVRVIGYREMS